SRGDDVSGGDAIDLPLFQLTEEGAHLNPRAYVVSSMQCTTWSCNGATSNSLLVHIVMCSAPAANCLDGLARFFPNSTPSGTGGSGQGDFLPELSSPVSDVDWQRSTRRGKTKKGRINMKLQNLIHILMG